MNKKILLFLILIILLVIAGTVLYFQFIKLKPIFQLPTEPKNPQSIEKQTELWANGTRCSARGFSIPPKPEDFVRTSGAKFLINELAINFTDDATCKDAERIAALINGKIIGFEPVTNLYGIQIPTRTVSELETAIQTVNNLNDPKIEGAFKAVVPVFHFVE